MPDLRNPSGPGSSPTRRIAALSVRARVLAWVTALSALGMAVAGVTAYAVQGARVDMRVNDAQEVQEVQEFRQFATTGVDPESGQSFQSVERLLFVALQRNIPDEWESFLTLADDQVLYVPPGRRAIRLEDAPNLVETLAALPADAPVVQDTTEVDGREVRYAAVKVSIQGDPSVGTYVIGYDVAGERAEVVAAAQTFAGVALISLVLVAFAGWLVAGRLLRPVTLLRETTQRISDTDLSERIPVRGNDDVSDLARTFNAMLDRLETAFGAQQRFIDDAGHELRTPVTIIRGHLEVLDPDDPAEVSETRALVLDELDRVHRLVEDLVMLARTRRPDFVHPVPLDLGQLTDEVLDKARALGPRQWRIDSRAEVEVIGDEQRLTQALLQLAANAVRHTGVHDVIAVGSDVDGDTAQIWVRDTGEGIAPQDLQRIFERFARGSTQPGRGADGSGLGLAIVRAIAGAHGGTVATTSVLGSGSRFVLELPIAPAAESHLARATGGREADRGSRTAVAAGNASTQGRSPGHDGRGTP